MRVGIYYPFRIFPGGGEKYILKIVELLAAQYDIEFISPEQNDYIATAKFFGITLPTEKIHQRRVVHQLGPELLSDLRSTVNRPYDLFINMSNTVLADTRGLGRRNIWLIQFPFPNGIYNSPFQRWLIRQRAQSYDLVLAYSQFAADWIQKQLNVAYHLNRPIQVLYPWIALPSNQQIVKQHRILSVGRFFAGGHNKKHAELIRAFRRLCDSGIQGWGLVLAGSTRPEPEHQQYIADLRAAAAGYPITFATDVSESALQQLYASSTIYWHATGLGEDVTTHPELMEHFGITIVEAMAYGCIPIVYGEGGPVEIIDHDQFGRSYHTIEQLTDKTQELIQHADLVDGLRTLCQHRATEFALGSFVQNLTEILSGTLLTTK